MPIFNATSSFVVLLFVSVLLCSIACQNKPQTDEPLPLQLNALTTRVYTGDTVILFLKGNTSNADVTWNIPVTKRNDSFIWVVQRIAADSVVQLVSATVKSQTTSISFSVMNSAYRDSIVSFSRTILPLMQANCNFSGCHGSGSRAGRVSLHDYDSIRLYSVIPYEAASSKLYYSLIKTDPLRVMPPAGKLHGYKIESVRLWIEQGAKRN